MRENVRQHSRENRKQKTSLRLAEKKDKKPTNWAEITKKCKEAGLTYGQAVARGII